MSTAKKYFIRRPPILQTFDLPTREELLKVKPGYWVKLIFTDEKGDNGERMWVRVTKVDGTYGYGYLDNEPLDPITLGVKRGDEVKFHLGDVISLLDENGRELSMKRKSTRGRLHI